MSKQIIIPFGPQHPVLPEPLHLDLVLEDEVVVDVIPSIGYVHRGLEKLVEKREYTEYVFIAERICGICSFIHSLTYVNGIEQIMKIEVPERAQYLRTIWSEYSRLHSHLLWLGCFADGMGFESVFMNAWRLREHILDDLEATTGGRVIQGVCKVGGVRRDITPERLDEMVKGLKELERELQTLTNVFLYDKSIASRLKGVGVLSKDDAYYLGAVGPTARGSGLGIDLRQTGYSAYDRINFKPVVETSGDCVCPVYSQGKRDVHLDRHHRAVREEDPRRTNRRESDRCAQWGIFLPCGTAPRRSRSLHQRRRHQAPCAAPGEDADIYQPASARKNAQGC